MGSKRKDKILDTEKNQDANQRSKKKHIRVQENMFSLCKNFLRSTPRLRGFDKTIFFLKKKDTCGFVPSLGFLGFEYYI